MNKQHNPQLIEWLRMNSVGKQFTLSAFDVEYMALEARLHGLIEFESVDYGDSSITYTLTPEGEQALGIPATEGDGDVPVSERQAEILRHLDAIQSSGWWDTSTDKYQQNVQDTEILINKGLVLRLPYNRFMISDLGKEWVKANPQPSTPAPVADPATGYRCVDKNGYSYVYRDDQLLFIGVLSENAVVDLLTSETATLRSQLASVQAATQQRIEALLLENHAERTRLQAELQAAQERVETLQSHVSTVVGEATQRGERLAELQGAIQEALDLMLDSDRRLLSDMMYNAQSTLQHALNKYDNT